MKHLRAFLLLTFVLIVSVASGQDFRDVNWGATRAQVKATETFTAIGERGENLYYEGVVAGLNTSVVYSFCPTSDFTQPCIFTVMNIVIKTVSSTTITRLKPS